MSFSIRRCGSIVGAVILLIACDREARDSQTQVAAKQTLPPGVSAFRVPEMTEITDSALRKSAARGRAILESTRDSLPDNVGNSLRCSSCHLAAGTTRNAMAWVGVYSRFPQYRPRSGRVVTIEDRINGCLQRSMNGKALDPSTSAMRDIVAYMAFLSLGVPGGGNVDGQGLVKLDAVPGDSTRGLAVFTQTCARCHGTDGQGTKLATPLWGPQSYNDGAGMARIGTLASFAHELMPFDKPRTLSVQQAYDVSVYINSRPRPTFAGRVNDYPIDPPPTDFGYPLPPRPSRTPLTR